MNSARRSAKSANDSDEQACVPAGTTLAFATDCIRRAGNALEIDSPSALKGPFDLVPAGGLFDYSPERHAIFLIRRSATSCWSRTVTCS